MRRVAAVAVGVAGTLAIAASALTGGAEAQVGVTAPFPNGQSHYYEYCGGCHGLQGVSAQSTIPVLKDRVGAFMCTAEGRGYLVRLPNVAFAAADDRTLADMMNFVVFELGRRSVKSGTARFTPAEVGALRRRPLKNEPLAQMRSDVLGRAISQCSK